jgi:hypothetical protein
LNLSLSEKDCQHTIDHHCQEFALPVLQRLKPKREVPHVSHVRHLLCLPVLLLFLIVLVGPAQGVKQERSEKQKNAKFTVLKENIEHHVEEEEAEMFKKARQALSEEEIEVLGERLQAAKQDKAAAAR